MKAAARQSTAAQATNARRSAQPLLLASVKHAGVGLGLWLQVVREDVQAKTCAPKGEEGHGANGHARRVPAMHGLSLLKPALNVKIN